MKKLTNRTDTKNALEAFGVEATGEDLITSKGNKKGVSRYTDEEELQSNIDMIYEYWMKRGFPYYAISIGLLSDKIIN